MKTRIPHGVIANINRQVRAAKLPRIEWDRTQISYQGTSYYEGKPTYAFINVMVTNSQRANLPIFGLGTSRRAIKDQPHRQMGIKLALSAAIRDYIRNGKALKATQQPEAVEEAEVPGKEIPAIVGASNYGPGGPQQSQAEFGDMERTSQELSAS